MELHDRPLGPQGINPPMPRLLPIKELFRRSGRRGIRRWAQSTEGGRSIPYAGCCRRNKKCLKCAKVPKMPKIRPTKKFL